VSDTTTAAGSGEQFAQLGDVQLCYETFGDRALPPVLLIMGLSSQMVMWEDQFCERLAGKGFWVIRFDNRDVGRSTIMRESGVPTRFQLLVRDRRAASYSLADMAADAAGMLDQLGVSRAHIVGASMGGMLAQLIAINHPDRVLSLVSIMSTTGNRRVGNTNPTVLPVLFRRRPRDREAYVRDFVDTFTTIGSKRYPPDEDRLRALAERCARRGVHPAGSARQLAAILTAPDRTPLLNRLSVAATVIHGDADRLVSPSGGRATAAAIPGTRLVMIPGMAHDLPPVLWDQIIDEIVLCAQRGAEATNVPASAHQLEKEESR
jgi:pimeloyl-ACP methyl ester carboxylesterase